MAQPAVHVQKLNTRGEVTLTYPATLRERLSNGARLDAYWTRPPLHLGYTTFMTGDHFIEEFYTDRWYNIFEIHAGTDGTLKGWYCNIAEPATISETIICSRDLLLDLWVAPDGSLLVLDEDEFAADTLLDDITKAAARRALNDLEACVRAHAHPFTSLP
ncbi:MAG: hypothetical protein OJF49_000225 [Ktedonobacterales bacterium]|jgi:hypothetical protein|nr:MAG: hypothetical protein OJF49_000225 [Ktedonobacterales bacterium]